MDKRTFLKNAGLGGVGGMLSFDSLAQCACGCTEGFAINFKLKR